jgi:hypothetical protein
MEITVYSRNRLYETFARWGVPRDFADTMANYLVYGYSPGSCFSAILANDFVGAMAHSHPSNTVEALKSLVSWIVNSMPEEAHGSYEKVSAWCGIHPVQRRIILEYNGLIYTEKEEVMLILKDEPAVKPVLY